MTRDKVTRYYAAGQVILTRRSGGLYCVHAGEIKLTKAGGDGKEQSIRLVKPGDVLGYRALVAEGRTLRRRWPSASALYA